MLQAKFKRRCSAHGAGKATVLQHSQPKKNCSVVVVEQYKTLQWNYFQLLLQEKKIWIEQELQGFKANIKSGERKQKFYAAQKFYAKLEIWWQPSCFAIWAKASLATAFYQKKNGDAVLSWNWRPKCPLTELAYILQFIKRTDLGSLNSGYNRLYHPSVNWPPQSRSQSENNQLDN